jgi:hypothetical protein
VRVPVLPARPFATVRFARPPLRPSIRNRTHVFTRTHTDNASAVRDTLPGVGTFQNRMLKTGGKQQAAVNLAKEAEASAVEKANKARELKA